MGVIVCDWNCRRCNWWVFWLISQSLMAFCVGALSPCFRFRMKKSLSY